MGDIHYIVRYLIENGRLIDPSAGMDQHCDLLIENGIVAGRVRPGEGKGWEPEGTRLNAKGYWVVPGLIDMHVHLREPGQAHKETLASGTQAAAAGGFTAVAAMPNTQPVLDDPSWLEWVRTQAQERGNARVWPVAAMTLGSRGQVPCDFARLASAGAVAVSDDGKWVPRADVMADVLQKAAANGLLAITHAEDPALSAGGVMNQGPAAEALGYPGIPILAEETAVARDIDLARRLGVRLHVAHVSTTGSCRIIRRAKDEGVHVTAETAPHYFTLTDQAVTRFGTAAKMNPPLRSDQDVRDILDALADGTIDAVATDHAPHTPDEKAADFIHAPFGIVGLETALPLVLARVREGILSAVRAIELLAANPARLLGVSGGALSPGVPADLTLIDPDEPWIVRSADFFSMGHSTPFEGLQVQGRAVLTMVQGRITHHRLPLARITGPHGLTQDSRR